MFLVSTAIYLLSVLCLCAAAQIEWVHPPESRAVLPGQDVTLDCQAWRTGGGGDLAYTWTFNGGPLPAETSRFFNQSVLVPHVTTSSIGTYVCVVSDGLDSSVQQSAVVILAYINSFQLHPKSMRAKVDTEVVLECITGRSAPYADTHWELNGAKLTDGEQLTATYGDYDRTGLSRQYSMKLRLRLKAVHAGIIRCVAVNKLLGRVVSSSDASLRLIRTVEQPKLLIPPAAHVVSPANSSLVLDCLIEGYGTRVIWYKDNVIIDGTATSYVHNNGSIVFVRVLLEDAGIYRCVGVSSVGSVTSPSSNVTVSVLNIDFKMEPRGATVFAGQNLTLNCIPPISVPPAKVTWYKDYKPLVVPAWDLSLSLADPEAGIWDLKFKSVQSKDGGVYFCVAENHFAMPTSRTSRVAMVTVQGAPVFTEPPLNQRVTKGRLLLLVCRVDGSPAPTVTWLFHGNVLHPSAQISFRDNSREMRIANMDKSFEGTYTCVAENKFGKKTAIAVVRVSVQPVTLTSTGDLVVTSGDTALLPCDVYGDPIPATLWYKDDALIQIDRRVRLVKLTLQISNATTSDAGRYACLAQNEAGNTWANGTLSVHVPPRIVIGPSDSTVVIGQSLLVPCKTEGIPKPKINWLFNSTGNLPEGVSLLSNRITLKITPVVWQHVGTYTCVAINVVGQDSRSGTITLRVPPTIQELTGQSIVDNGETIQLECIHQGVLAPSIEWFHKGEVIQDSLDGRISYPMRNSLSIKFSTLSDSGNYGCQATNGVGTAFKEIQVFVIEPPKPPLLSSVVPLSASSVELTWIPNSQEPHTSVAGFAVSYKKRPDTEYRTYTGRLPPELLHYEVEGLDPGAEYTFTVSAENSAGLGSPSNARSVVTLEAGPSEPVGLRLISISARLVRLSWEIPRQPHGQIRKYQLQYHESALPLTNNTEFVVRDILDPNLPNQEFDLTDLHPFTRYSIQVRAGNIQNEVDLWGSLTSPVEVITLQSAPTAPPREITAVSLSPTVIKVTWQAPSTSEWNGPLLGFVVKYRQLQHDTGRRQSVDGLGLAREVSLTGLSPWRNYSLVLEAINSAGNSPQSSAVIVETLPAAPVISPLNVKVSVLSSSTISVSWQVPSKTLWYSRLDGSILRYREDKATVWTNLTVATTTVTHVNMSELTPWTTYQVKIAVFTHQVTPGVGPFSPSFAVRTLADVPEQVEIVEHSATNTSIWLYWRRPTVKNGHINHYIVTYFAIGRRATDGPSSDVHGRPGVSSNQKGPVSSLSTTQLNITIGQLSPATVYNVSVAAVTMAGDGPSQYVVISTAFVATTPKTVPTASIFTTDNSLLTTASMLLDTSPTSNRQLPVIVAGSLTAGVFVLVIIAIIIWRCLRRRQAGREQYMKSVISGIKITKRDTDNDRQILDPGSHEEEEDMTSPDLSHSVTNDDTQHYGSFNSNIPVPHSPTSVDSNMNKAESQKSVSSTSAVKRTDSFFSKLRHSISGDSVFTISGIENPSYFTESAYATLPRPNVPSMTADEVYSQSDRSLRKNRMRSESAAAIAVMRSSGNLTILPDDTDVLIQNEAVVVYNERTAL